MEHVYGPYRNRSAWRVVVVGADGTRVAHTRPSREEAEALIEVLRRKKEIITVERALSEYLAYLAARGRKPRSIETTEVRLRELLVPVRHLPVADLPEKRCAQLYERYALGRAPDTHRNALGQVRTFRNWIIKRGWARTNPWLTVEPIGTRSAGKPQLRIDEARRLAAKAFELAVGGDRGALAVLLALLCGLRASEIVNIVDRDVDAGGQLLWISAAKTRAGVRRLELPPALGQLLLAAGPRPFGHRRWWVREQVHRLCKLAGVPLVTAHSLRGLHATLAVGAGQTSHAVAAALGHASFDVTQRHYLAPGSTTPAAANMLFPGFSPGLPSLPNQSGRLDSNQRPPDPQFGGV